MTRAKLTFSARAREYLALRHGLGFAMKIEGAHLLRFAEWADTKQPRARLTVELAVQWACLPQGVDPTYRARRLDIVRRFARHLALFDARTEVPPPHLLGPSYRRKPPHIYTSSELTALLDAAARLGPAGGLRPHTYVTLFGLLASTGLRISEALHLTRSDVDLDAGLLTVSESKFHKSRLVPLHPSVVAALRRYASHRHRCHPETVAGTFFLTEKGTRLTYWRAMMAFTGLRRQLRWTGRRPPRIHDLRHTFAVRRLLRWHEEGADVDREIAALSTYLGHAKVTDTYWYLSAVPELLAVTAARFERYAHVAAEGQP
jgi:integrase